jgi:cytoskeletal protein RodZ
LFGQQERVLSSSAERVQTDAREEGWLSRLKSYFGPRNALQWGFAIVALALLLAGLWLVLQNMRLRNELEATQRQTNELAQRERQLQQQLAQARADASQPRPSPVDAGQTPTPDRSQTPSTSSILSLVLTPPVRSSQGPPTVQIKPDTTAIAVTLMLEPNPFSIYRVALIDGGRRQLWRSPAVRSRDANGSKAIHVRFTANLLKPAAYALRVMAVDPTQSNEVVGEYPFRVVR